MTTQRLSRRSFLKILTASAIVPCIQQVVRPQTRTALSSSQIGAARVTLTNGIYIYSEPSFQSDRLKIARRDQILVIYEEIISPTGPAHNPRWYRIESGYVHSGYLQRVEKMHLNIPLLQVVPEGGQLGEITVAYTQSYRRVRSSGWERLYRLYYKSVHWITGLSEGPHGKYWYRITDDLLNFHHYVPATHVRPITPEELEPISPEVPAEAKRIEVLLQDQILNAYENDRLVLTTKVATGVPTLNQQPGEIPTDTPSGRFYIQTKWPSRHMGDGRITSDLHAYELPGVPWVCIFHKDGLALHGTFWHDNFGRRMSHGCINLPNDAARWIFRWTDPSATHHEMYTRGLGTRLDIQESVD